MRLKYTLKLNTEEKMNAYQYDQEIDDEDTL